MTENTRTKLKEIIVELKNKLDSHSTAYPLNGSASVLDEWRQAYDAIAGDLERLTSAYGKKSTNVNK